MLRYAPLAWMAVVIASGCASTGGVPRPFPLPGPPAASTPADKTSEPGTASPRSPSNAAARGDGYAIAGTALSLRGTPYRNGGADPSSGFDCSGFVQFVFGQYGVAMPRGVRDQFMRGTPVAADALEPGDLLFFTTTAPGASHVAIAIGGDQFVHAPSSSGSVRVESLGSSYWAPRFVGARRLN